MKKKLNALMVSGLTIGPVLGSGIVFLPPLAYEELGQNAIMAWIIVMALGALFAYVFTKLAVIAPNNQGISAIVGNMLGDQFRELSANYLTMAVLFGPIVVALTAAEFLQPLFSDFNAINQTTIAITTLIICALLVISGAAFMSRVMLVLSSITACLLLIGSLATLLRAPLVSVPFELPDFFDFGYVLLLIFWSVFGWEVIGNYVEEVEEPAATMMQAMKISLVGIVSVYLGTSFALQNSPGGTMASILSPIFGQLSVVVFGLLSAGLCMCTIVTFTGAVSRQTVDRMKTARMPVFFQKKLTAVLALFSGNLIVLGAVSMGWLSFNNVIEVANMLFIGNAFLGLVSGYKLIHQIPVRIGIGFLLLMMLLIIAFLPFYSILFFLLITGMSLFFNRQKIKRADCIPDKIG